MHSTTAVILAGGLGTRFGADRPKQLVKIAGRPILAYTLDVINATDLVDNVILVANPEWHDAIEAIALDVGLAKPMRMVDGGPSRNDSVWNALSAEPGFVGTETIVHDGVRPLASPSLIRSAILATREHRAIVPVTPSADALFRVANGRVEAIEDRATVLHGQSPQGFQTKILEHALRSLGEARGRFATLYEAVLAVDPSTAIQAIPGEFDNIKVTQAVDQHIAHTILVQRDKTPESLL